MNAINGNPDAARWHLLRLLIVDDNQQMLHILRTLLRGFGITQIEEARDPALAFETFRAVPIDIIIVDLMMEVLDGLDFVRLVRGAKDSPNPLVPIVMLTAYSERSRVITARDAGVTEFLRKPVTAADLYKKLLSVVHMRRPYVRTPNYFGPDRRRHRPEDYDGEERRVDDPMIAGHPVFPNLDQR